MRRLPTGMASSKSIRIFIDPLLGFNLGITKNHSDLYIQSRGPVPLLVDEIPKALGVEILRVSDPITNDKEILNASLAELKNWFKGSNRLIKVGDLIAVVVDGEFEFSHDGSHTRGKGTYQDKYSRAIFRLCCVSFNGFQILSRRFPFTKAPSKNLAYFKVGSIDGIERANHDTYRIDPGETRILQKGVTSSRLPLGMRFYKDIGSIQPLPKAENKALASLLTLVQSCVSPSIVSKKVLYCRALVHGKEGIGKTAIIRTIADYSGLVLCPVRTLDRA